MEVPLRSPLTRLFHLAVVAELGSISADYGSISIGV